MGFWHIIAVYRRRWVRFLSIAVGFIPSYYLSAKFGLTWYWTAPIIVTTALGVPLAWAACYVGDQQHPIHWSYAIKIIARLTGMSIAWLQYGLGRQWYVALALGLTIFGAVPILIGMVLKLNDARHSQIDHRLVAGVAQDNVDDLGTDPGKGALGGT